MLNSKTLNTMWHTLMLKESLLLLFAGGRLHVVLISVKNPSAEVGTPGNC